MRFRRLGPLAPQRLRTRSGLSTLVRASASSIADCSARYDTTYPSAGSACSSAVSVAVPNARACEMSIRGDRADRARRRSEPDREDAEPLEDEAAAVRDRERSVAAQRASGFARVERDGSKDRSVRSPAPACRHGACADDHDVGTEVGVRATDQKTGRSRGPVLHQIFIAVQAASTSATVFGVAAVKVLAALRGHEHVVLDAHADVPERLRARCPPGGCRGPARR